MLIDFDKIKEMTISGMNGGLGTMSAKMYIDKQGKVIQTKVHSGGSIGVHKHKTSDDINFILSGTGKAICDGQEELLIFVKKAQNIVLRILVKTIWYCLR